VMSLSLPLPFQAAGMLHPAAAKAATVISPTNTIP